MSSRADTPTHVVRIVADGAFGREVADHLAALLWLTGRAASVDPVPLDGDPSGLFSGADACVRASWRDIRAEWNESAEAALIAGRTFLPIAFAHPYVRVGPAVAPGLAPCHRCYSLRARQHANLVGDPNPVNDEYERALARDVRLGVTGYPPHIAAMAAGLAVTMLGAAGGRPLVGWVARIDCGTDEVQNWRVIPTHGCQVCGPDLEPEARAKARRDRLRTLARPPVGDDSGQAG
jgi:bacteriocin biosynthesis cyclodehydratase domain-containing protein